MEEHQGRITLDDAPPDFAEGHGACVSLRFAAQTVEQPALIA
jgi:hypothetical protein